MECVSCGGNGCIECDGIGAIKVTCCPLEYVTNDVWEVIQYVELYKKGLPPVAGGALDQAKNFIDSARFIFRENEYWRAKLGVF